MKTELIQIRWHVQEQDGKPAPVMSLDFHPSEPGLLATAGADKMVHLWGIADNQAGEEGTTFKCALAGHNNGVNVVRFSPNGECLATAGDDAAVIVWARSQTAAKDWTWRGIDKERDLTRANLR
jgi:chromatin assembly factor 1 subunit B